MTSSLRVPQHEIEESIAQLDDKLKSLPNDLKQEWQQAQEKCGPSLVGNEHKLLFLECENFHIELAALRLLRYWSKRVELFGSSKAFEPMTLEGAMRDEKLALSHPTLIWTATHDDLGRGILYENFQGSFDYYHQAFRERFAQTPMPTTSANDNDKHHDPHNAPHSSKWTKKQRKKYMQQQRKAFLAILRLSIIRVKWYIFHVALQNDKVRQNGVLYISRPRPFPLHLLFRLDTEHGNLVIDMLRGCLPLRVAAFHRCQPALGYRIMTIWKYKKRAKGPLLDAAERRTHVGSSASQVMKSLRRFGIREESVPPEVGGTLQYNHARWLELQRDLEAKTKACNDDEEQDEDEDEVNGYGAY